MHAVIGPTGRERDHRGRIVVIPFQREPFSFQQQSTVATQGNGPPRVPAKGTTFERNLICFGSTSETRADDHDDDDENGSKLAAS